MRRFRLALAVLAASLLLPVAPEPVHANELEAELGRAEVRILSAPFQLVEGRTVRELALPERLERRDYRRVHERPDEVGEYFWGHEIFWIYRRSHRVGGRDFPAALIGLRLEPGDGRIAGLVTSAGVRVPLDGDGDGIWLEPVLLAESLGHDRALRRRVELSDLPEHVWRAVLAAEDHRFFDHPGVDPRAVARAALVNARAGQVVEGGSTITQQLVKNRELTATRSLGRKMSEAVRALALEAQHDKRDILEAYLNQVYLGHVGGVAIHGLGTASRVYFDRAPSEMSLAESATLAAMIQGPNRLDPARRPEAVRQRRSWVLSRMESLGWTSSEERRQADSEPVRGPRGDPRRPPAPRFLDWVAELVRREAPVRIERQRGVVIETSLDRFLQTHAEEVVRDALSSLERRSGNLGRGSLEVALVAIDAATGDVLAHVGGDPRDDDGDFDRMRRARRQPGSIVKPLLLLEAFQDCGDREPLHPASRVADEPVRIELESGPWEPVNADGAFRGVLTPRRALVESRNVPFVRMVRWCGWKSSAEGLERLGLDLPEDPPPAFVLGAVESSPLAVARAYTVFPELGRVRHVRPVHRIERPAGRPIATVEPRARVVVEPATAYLVDDMLRESVRHGTARAAALGGTSGVEAAAKTGTSSGERDAWLAGHAGGIVTVVWVGRDAGRPVGFPASEAAAPIWRRFMSRAVETRAPRRVLPPDDVVELWLDSATGLLVRERNPRAVREIFRRGATPRRDRFWRSDDPVPVVR